MADLNFDKLAQRAQELQALINDASGSLHQDQSNVSVHVERTLSKCSTTFAKVLSKSFSRGKIEEIIPVVAIVGSVWLGAKGYDGIINYRAKKQAREALLSYYQELMVKQNLIIARMKEITQELADQKNALSDRVSCLQVEYNELMTLAQRILDFQQAVS